MLPCSEGECNNYVWISIVSITTQSILYQLDCARYYKIRQTIVLILRPSEHAKTSTSKRYISRSTCLKFNLKTVLNSDNHGGSNSKTAALIITLAKSVLSPLAAPLCSVHKSTLNYIFIESIRRHPRSPIPTFHGAVHTVGRQADLGHFWPKL